MSSSSDEVDNNMELTPPDILSKAQIAQNSLLPSKSREDLPSLISITVAASMSLASYEIFDSFDEVNPASSEVSRIISIEPRNTTKTIRTRATTEAMNTYPTDEVDLPDVADWSLDTRKPSTEWLTSTESGLNTSRADEVTSTTSSAGLNTSTVANESSNANMVAADGHNASTVTTESTLRVTVGYSRRKINQKTTVNRSTTLPPLNLTVPPDGCPEEEKPLNIGPYEVPTQRDLVLHVRRILLHMFRSYHKKTLEVLKDMKEATKSSWPKEESCQGASKSAYRRCVRTVSNRCELAAKSLVLAVEELRGDVLGLLQGKVCNIEDMNADPIQLIRILAMEKVSLEFALPGFLRLLNACAGHCTRPNSTSYSRKPLRRKMTDQDLVIRHFLTQKSYSKLLKGTI